MCPAVSRAVSPQQRGKKSVRGTSSLACIAALPGSDLFFLKSSVSELGGAWLSLKEKLPNFWLMQPELSSWTHVSSLCHPPASLPRTPWPSVPSRGYVRAVVCSPLPSCCGGLQASHFFHFPTPVRKALSLIPCLVYSQQFLVYAGYCMKLKSKESAVRGCSG